MMEYMYGAKEKEEVKVNIVTELMKLQNLLLILLFVSNVSFAEPLKNALANKPISVSTNNAGNIVYCNNNNWIGQVGKHKQFVIFDTKENGLRAMEIVLKKRLLKESTVSSFVSKYTNESLTHKHIQNYANAIRQQIGRDHLKQSDSEQLLPLIVFLEGGTKAFNYYFGVNNVRTKRYRSFNYFIQNEIVKHGICRRTIKQTNCYSLRDVLLPT